MPDPIETPTRAGESGIADELLPLVYDELLRLARARMAQLTPGQTLQPTALVHEAYLRLAARQDHGHDVRWESRAHFFFAAARAMHDILVEQARRKMALKRGGGRKRIDVDRIRIATEAPPDELVALSTVLEELEREDPRGHELVMLRFFAGLGESQTAELLGLSERTVRRDWRYLRVTLHQRLSADGRPDDTTEG